MWKNNEYKIQFEEDAIFEHERIMLSSGDCMYLVPMVFMGEDGKETAYYQTYGFRPLSAYRINSLEDALFILEKTVLILSKVVEYLIDPHKITLSMDTVFYNQETGTIKIAYVPLPSDSVSINKLITNFIKLLSSGLNKEGKTSMEQLAKQIKTNNYKTRDIINKIGMIRKGFNASDFA